MTPPSATRFRAKLEKRSDADTSPFEWGGEELKRPTHRRIGTKHHDALVAARHLDPLRSVQRLGLQGDALFVGRQAVEAGAVQRGEGFELVERVLLHEDLGIDLHSHRRIEDAGAAAGAFLGIGGMRRGVGAEKERRIARGRGTPERETMLLALGNRQAIEVWADAALEDRIAIVA